IRWPVQGGAYPAMYAAMQTDGRPISFQTAAPAQIGDWYQALDWAVRLGANSIELNRDYTNYDATQLESIRQRLLGTSSPPPPPSGSTALITSFTKTTLRNDFLGWVVERITVGSADISVTSLGRYVVAGNAASH